MTGRERRQFHQWFSAPGTRHCKRMGRGSNVAELTARDAKLIQYLNEAFGKEKQLETALEAHIAMTSRAPYQKRLKQHLQETKGHAREVERRIKQLGGTAETVSVPGPDVVSEAASRVQEVAQRGMALAQGSLHAARGTGEQEKQLKNAKTEFSDEAEEIANYTAIETLAKAVGDRTTATLARNIRRQEERMASFLERLIPSLTKAVAQAEIPASQRNGAGRRRSTTSRSRRARQPHDLGQSATSRARQAEPVRAQAPRDGARHRPPSAGLPAPLGRLRRASAPRPPAGGPPQERRRRAPPGAGRRRRRGDRLDRPEEAQAC